METWVADVPRARAVVNRDHICVVSYAHDSRVEITHHAVEDEIENEEGLYGQLSTFWQSGDIQLSRGPLPSSHAQRDQRGPRCYLIA